MTLNPEQRNQSKKETEKNQKKNEHVLSKRKT